MKSDAKTRYYTNSLMGDPAHEVLPEAREYIRELETETERLRETLVKVTGSNTWAEALHIARTALAQGGGE